MRFVAVIPVRGGSKGIPHKNFRTLLGKPMAGWTIEAALHSSCFSDVVITSDSPTAALLARKYGVSFHQRSRESSTDEATICDAMREVMADRDEDCCVVLQATSPLRGAASIRSAIREFETGGFDSLMSVHSDRHLCWLRSAESDPQPLFSERVNRQQLKEAVLRESGAIQICRTEILKNDNSLIGQRHHLYELPKRESVDIDTLSDLAEAEQLLSTGLIVFRVTGNSTVGTGHLYHCLQLANHLKAHDIHFILKECDSFAQEAVECAGFNFDFEDAEMDVVLDRIKDTPSRRVIVNDVLDTSVIDIAKQRAAGFRVISVEDLGSGAMHADAVINALYNPSTNLDHPTVYNGPKYAPLRPEFACVPDKTCFENNSSQVLLTFGGADPNNLSSRCAKILSKIPGIKIRVILGPAYSHSEDFPECVEIVRETQSMAAELFAADVAITSAGRTVFEAAAVGTPPVVIAQNVRESTHSHLSLSAGVSFLGLYSRVSDEQIINNVESLLSNGTLRQELSTLLKANIDTLGIDRIARIIESTMKGTDQ